MYSRTATSRFVSPEAASSATSRSASVSASGAARRSPIRDSSSLACAAQRGAGSPSKMASAASSDRFAAAFALARRCRRPNESSARARSNGQLPFSC